MEMVKWTCYQRPKCIFFGKVKPEDKISSMMMSPAEVKNDEAEVTNFSLRIFWKAAQVAAHERLFLFSDNLTTFMFIIASDLSENQRERLTSFLCIQGMAVTAYTLKKVKVAFGELFCSPEGASNCVEILQLVQNIHD